MSWERRLDDWRTELALFDQLHGWVTLAEAGERTGVSRSTLRAWYRAGQIRSQIVDGPHGPQRLVHIDEVAARSERSARIRNRSEHALGLEAQIEVLQHRVNQLEVRLAALETGDRPPDLPAGS